MIQDDYTLKIYNLLIINEFFGINIFLLSSLFILTLFGLDFMYIHLDDYSGLYGYFHEINDDNPYGLFFCFCNLKKMS